MSVQEGGSDNSNGVEDSFDASFYYLPDGTPARRSRKTSHSDSFNEDAASDSGCGTNESDNDKSCKDDKVDSAVVQLEVGLELQFGAAGRLCGNCGRTPAASSHPCHAGAATLLELGCGHRQWNRR